MKYFDTVDTKENLSQYKYSTRQSSIIRANETNDIRINGVNIVVDMPAVGDVLCITRKMENGKLLGPDSQEIVWMRGSTIEAASFPGDLYEAVGVVYKVQGRHVWVIYREAPELRFANVTIFKVYSIFSGSSATITITNLKINCNGTTIFEHKGDLEFNNIRKCGEWLNTNFNSLETNKYFNITDSDANEFTIICKPYCNCSIPGLTHGVQYDLIGTGKNNDNIGCDYDDSAGYVRKDKTYNYFVGANYDAFYEYTTLYGNGGVFSSNIPVNKTTFENNPDCEAYRNRYGTYSEYIKSFMPAWPVNTGLFSEVSDGRVYTHKLAIPKYYDPEFKTQMQLYPAAVYANNISVNKTELLTNNWYIPAAIDLYDIYTAGNVIKETCSRINFPVKPLDGKHWSITGSKSVQSSDTIYIYNNVAIGNVKAIGAAFLENVVSPAVFNIKKQPNYVESHPTMCITDFDF